jgi:hypothetical protein
MSAGSMALTGDATGTVGHLAAALSHEIVNHVVTEHTAMLGGGVIRTLFSRKKKPSHDAAPELSPADYAALQEFVEKLAKAAVELNITDERMQELLAQKNAGQSDT